ncbi:MAG: cytochrome c [Acidobacteria bacterium]|nr:cytochrome c [Acidobacteriota bacterium]
MPAGIFPRDRVTSVHRHLTDPTGAAIFRVEGKTPHPVLPRRLMAKLFTGWMVETVLFSPGIVLAPCGPWRVTVTHAIRCGWMVLLVSAFAAAASAQEQDAIDAGRKVFAAQKCSICHSVGGQGNPRGVLDGVGSKHSADVIREWLMNAPEMAAKVKAERKPAMKVFAGLPKEEMDALVTYLASLKK